MRDTFVRTLCQLAEEDKTIYLLSGDLGFGVLDKFWNVYPEQFLNMGICEQNMASVAAGMGLEGKNVFIYSIANFPTLRCIEQIRNDIAYHGANVTVVAVGGGFSYGALGMSHHATEDIAIMRALPNMKVFAPCDPIETIEVTKLAAKLNGPSYIRLGRGGEEILHAKSDNIKIEEGNQLCEGKHSAILAAGAIACEAVEASRILENIGINCSVYSFPTIKPIDVSLIKKVARQMEHIFTLEEHNIVGGFGSAVSEIIAEMSGSAAVTRLGLPDVYSTAVGTQKYLRNVYKLDAEAIAQRIAGKIGD